MEKVWCYSTVEESNIYQCVYRLRCVLRENARDPIDRYIANVSGTGYRFAVAVKQVSLSRTAKPLAFTATAAGAVQNRMPPARVVALSIGLDSSDLEADSSSALVNISGSLATGADQPRQRRASDAVAAVTPGLDADSFVNRLTATERRVLQMIADNLTSRDIALELCISIRTIENHRASIRAKLRLSGSNALLWFAAEHGWKIRRECKES